MRGTLLLLYLSACAAMPASAEENDRYFEDQLQFELFYEFSYQKELVESFLFECSGDRDVSLPFAYATASITNAYMHDIMGLGGLVPDPFMSKPLWKRLLEETWLIVMRDYDNDGDLADPVLMAQKDVLRLMDIFRDEKDLLCDFIFWEEVLRFEGVTVELIQDAKERKGGTPEIVVFEERAGEGLVVLTRLFDANPLKQSP